MIALHRELDESERLPRRPRERSPYGREHGVGAQRRRFTGDPHRDVDRVARRMSRSSAVRNTGAGLLATSGPIAAPAPSDGARGERELELGRTARAHVVHLDSSRVRDRSNLGAGSTFKCNAVLQRSRRPAGFGPAPPAATARPRRRTPPAGNRTVALPRRPTAPPPHRPPTRRTAAARRTSAPPPPLSTSVARRIRASAPEHPRRPGAPPRRRPLSAAPPRCLAAGPAARCPAAALSPLRLASGGRRDAGAPRRGFRVQTANGAAP